MKWILILCLVVSTQLFADTSDSKTIMLDGSTTNIFDDLRTTKTRIEWRQVDVPATCYRTVMRRQCQQVPPQCRTVCQAGRCQRVCSPPRTVCRTYPVQEPYRCMRRENRQVEVALYDVIHVLELRLNINHGQYLNETVRLNATGENFQLQQAQPNDFWIRVTPLQTREVLGQGTKEIHRTLQLDFIPR